MKYKTTSKGLEYLSALEHQYHVAVFSERTLVLISSKARVHRLLFRL